jgi:RNA polymerase sigma-70 factor (ECF subfamily)
VSAEPAARPRDFEAFFAHTYYRTLAQAIMLCGNREDAEDATQEAFVEAYRVWDRLATYDIPEAWVHRVMVQRIWKAYRTRRTGQDRLLELPVPVQAGPEQTAEAREVLGLLGSLPPRQRVTMVLFCLYGWSQQEIATALRMTRGGVAANVSKARQTLREALGRAADEVTRRHTFMVGSGWAGRGWIGMGRDPLEQALRNTEAWLRAAVQVEPRALERARAALARQLEERR